MFKCWFTFYWVLLIQFCFCPLSPSQRGFDLWDPMVLRFPSLVNCCTIDWYTAVNSGGIRPVMKHQRLAMSWFNCSLGYVWNRIRNQRLTCWIMLIWCFWGESCSCKTLPNVRKKAEGPVFLQIWSILLFLIWLWQSYHHQYTCNMVKTTIPHHNPSPSYPFNPSINHNKTPDA